MDGWMIVGRVREAKGKEGWPVAFRFSYVFVRLCFQSSLKVGRSNQMGGRRLGHGRKKDSIRTLLLVTKK